MNKLTLSVLSCFAGLALFATSAVAETIEPEIVIQPGEKSAVTTRKQGGSTIDEYRANGELYMIKVTPRKGPVYYLVDSNGDGDLDARKTDLDPNMLIPTWVLFSW
jgi:hypothetical protein